jgi:hypothetical protein
MVHVCIHHVSGLGLEVSDLHRKFVYALLTLFVQHLRQKPKSVPKVSTGHFFRGHFELSHIWTPAGLLQDTFVDTFVDTF